MLEGVSSRREERHSIWNLRQRGGEGRGSYQKGGGRITFFRDGSHSIITLQHYLYPDTSHLLRYSQFPQAQFSRIVFNDLRDPSPKKNSIA